LDSRFQAWLGLLAFGRYLRKLPPGRTPFASESGLSATAVLAQAVDPLGSTQVVCQSDCALTAWLVLSRPRPATVR
jgi:hypothetical protein